MTLINFQQHLNTAINPYACLKKSDVCVCASSRASAHAGTNVCVCVCVSTQTQSVFLEGFLVDVRRGGLAVWAGGFSPTA